MVYLLSFYVTESYLEVVKKALFDKGAGSYGKFENCCWEALGQGQYQINESQIKGELIRQLEYKVEVLCQEKYLKGVIEALKEVHPCDEPAFFLTRIETQI